MFLKSVSILQNTVRNYLWHEILIFPIKKNALENTMFDQVWTVNLRKVEESFHNSIKYNEKEQDRRMYI